MLLTKKGATASKQIYIHIYKIGEEMTSSFLIPESYFLLATLTVFPLVVTSEFACITAGCATVGGPPEGVWQTSLPMAIVGGIESLNKPSAVLTISLQ